LRLGVPTAAARPQFGRLTDILGQKDLRLVARVEEAEDEGADLGFVLTQLKADVVVET
jgi:hypothetical protein